MNNSDNPITELVAAVTNLRRAMVISKERWLGRLDLTDSQIRVIIQLAEHDRCTTTAVADLLRVTPSAATQTLEILVRRELVVRSADADDRRVIRHSLSDQGQLLASKIAAKRQSYFSELSRRLTPEELATTTKALRSFAQLIEQESESAPHQNPERIKPV